VFYRPFSLYIGHFAAEAPSNLERETGTFPDCKTMYILKESIKGKQ
jgi:hypothetical protein